MRGRAIIALAWLTAFYGLGSQTGGAREEPHRLPPDPTLLPSPLHCPVDGGLAEDRRHGVLWNGRHYYMDRQECLTSFMADPERYARQVEPRAALVSAPHPHRPSYGPAFLYLGLFVVVGLLSGAITSYVGIQKGLPGIRWFVTGFFLNGVAIAMVFRCRGREMLFSRKGLCKAPQTYDPWPCPCGNLNHPSADRCSGCGRDLQPTVKSDVARASQP